MEQSSVAFSCKNLKLFTKPKPTNVGPGGRTVRDIQKKRKKNLVSKQHNKTK